MFASTDVRRAYPRGVIGSTVVAYPRGTGWNPIGGIGTYFPHTVSSIFRLSLTHTHTHTNTHTACHTKKSKMSVNNAKLVIQVSMHTYMSVMSIIAGRMKYGKNMFWLELAWLNAA